MKKFILLDHSIQDSKGHHLEYALEVLKAAKDQNFKTYLLVNKQCIDLNIDCIDALHKSFKRTFYENNFGNSSSIMDKLEKYLYYCISLFKDISYLFIFHFGKIGEALIRNSDVNSIKNKIHHLDNLRLLNKYIAFFFIPFCTYYTNSKTGKKLIKYSYIILKQVIETFKFFLSLLKKLVIMLWNGLRRPKLSFRHSNDRFASVFSTELEKALRLINASGNDIIFVPTLGNVELSGVLQIEEKLLEHYRWHFLFRRNIFVFRETNYAKEAEIVLAREHGFNLVNELMINSNSCLNFYTDTKALTKQYNSLGMVAFSTLPIPVSNRLSIQQVSEKSPLTVSYIGDAREEKGYHLLEPMIADLKTLGYNCESINFVIHSHYNTQEGEPKIRVAKAQLLAYERPFVQLCEGPFSSEEYFQYIRETDITLIPYRASNYYARSSGIFAETLAAGKPFVVCNKSWMAQELLPYNNRYYKNMVEEQEVLQTVCLSSVFEKQDIVIRPRTKSDFFWIIVKAKQVEANVGVYMDITWDVLGDYSFAHSIDNFLIKNYVTLHGSIWPVV